MNYKEFSSYIKARQSLYPAQMNGTVTIPNEDIWKILENGNYAPSHRRTEPWRYIVFDKKNLKGLFEEKIEIYKELTPEEEIKEEKIEKFRKKAATFSHVIAICMKRDSKESVPVEEEEYAVACSVQNILLSMESLNIIGYWGTGKIAFSESMKKYLNLGEKDKCMGFLQLGVPKEGLPKIIKSRMSSIQEKVEWR